MKLFYRHYWKKYLLLVIITALVAWLLFKPCKLGICFQGFHPVGCLTVIALVFALPVTMLTTWENLKWWARKQYLSKQKIC